MSSKWTVIFFFGVYIGGNVFALKFMQSESASEQVARGDLDKDIGVSGSE